MIKALNAIDKRVEYKRDERRHEKKQRIEHKKEKREDRKQEKRKLAKYKQEKRELHRYNQRKYNYLTSHHNSVAYRQNRFINHLPRNSASIRFNGISFTFNDGLYYRKAKRGYHVVKPPRGLRIIRYQEITGILNTIIRLTTLIKMCTTLRIMMVIRLLMSHQLALIRQ